MKSSKKPSDSCETKRKKPNHSAKQKCQGENKSFNNLM